MFSALLLVCVYGVGPKLFRKKKKNKESKTECVITNEEETI